MPTPDKQNEPAPLSDDSWMPKTPPNHRLSLGTRKHWGETPSFLGTPFQFINVPRNLFHDTDDWEELQLRRANQEKARRACIADALPPNALRIGNHLGDMSSQGNGTDVRLFGRNAETQRAQLPTALPVTCTPAFMGLDSTTRSKKVTPTALTFGGTGGS